MRVLADDSILYALAVKHHGEALRSCYVVHTHYLYRRSWITDLLLPCTRVWSSKCLTICAIGDIPGCKVPPKPES
jgi:hypothetical protein